MSIEKTFVKEGIKESQIENYLKDEFKRAGYSRSEIHRTPVGTRIVVYANKPGLVIGRSGKRIHDITINIKDKFGFENPMIDVREVDEPFLDANIMADRIANSLERGINYKRVCSYYVTKIMEAGAIGVQIRASGKISGVERSRMNKFKAGFIAHSGDYADKLVDVGYTQANLKPGIAGITVKIMKELPQEFKAEEMLGDRIEEEKKNKDAADEQTVETAEEQATEAEVSEADDTEEAAKE